MMYLANFSFVGRQSHKTDAKRRIGFMVFAYFSALFLSILPSQNLGVVQESYV